MKISKRIKQISTGLCFDISMCHFYTDVVHFCNEEFSCQRFIGNDDWEFVEVETFNCTFNEMQVIEEEKAKQRKEVLAKAKELIPNPKHEIMTHVSLVMFQENTVEVLCEIYGDKGVTINDVMIYVAEYREQRQRKLNYIESEMERLNLKSQINYRY